MEPSFGHSDSGSQDGQHRAARFVKGDFQWTASVTEMLRYLHWDTLRSNWENLSLGLFKRFNLTCNSNLIANIFSSQSKGPKTSRSFKSRLLRFEQNKIVIIGLSFYVQLDNGITFL